MNPLDKLFSPEGVAVIGVSLDASKLSYGVVRNLIQHGYPGSIYPVNPRGGEILKHRVYPTILDVPDPLDLAVVMVNARIVPVVVEQCGQRGLKTVIVISSGFKETGDEGARLESQLKSIIDKYGIRLVGPNCVGVMDTYMPLDTTFIAHMPAQGHIGFVSHSGAICGGTIDWGISAGVGFSRILSLGNQLDVDIADGIDLLNQNSHTSVISVYAEGIPDGQKFIGIVSRISRRKPVVVLKAGLTRAGTRAVFSHTGALAGSTKAYLAACHRAGALVVDTLQEQYDVTNALASQPLPRGNHVAILTNAGGPAALAADSLDKYGLRLANLTTDTQNRLRPLTPAGTQLNNPVDMLGGPQGVMYRDAGKVLLEDPGVDMLISIYVPQALTPVMDVVQGVLDGAQMAEKPVVCCMVGGYSLGDAVRMLNSHGVPFYQDPDRASFSLSSLYRYQLLRHRERLSPEPIYDVGKDRVQILLCEIQQNQQQKYINPQQGTEIIRAYGIQVPESGIASSVREATSLAGEIGYPVALKLVAQGITHKTDAGGVALNLVNTREVQEAFERIIGDNAQYRALVQSMAVPGIEVIVGFQRDAQFGPVLVFGAGGTAVEVNQDVAFRLAPLSQHDARDMIDGTAVGQMLHGIRGGTASDVDSLVDVLQRVGQLASDFPAISELDINPLIVYERGQGCVAVDVRIVMQSVQEGHTPVIT